MSSDGKFILKIIIAILGIGLAAFLALAGNYYFRIKTGKVSSLQFTKSSITVSNVSKLDANKIMSSKAPYFGAASPELTVVMFGNFSCPYSQKSSTIFRETMIKYKDKAKFVYRDYPMDDIYPGSSYQALAGKCADEQNKFWAFYDKIYRAPKSDEKNIAAQIGLDISKFTDCLDKTKYYNDIKNDLTDGFNNGIRGTPTFFFIKKGYENEPLKIEGAMTKEIFEKMMEGLLK